MKLEAIKITDLSNGMITSGAVSDSLLPSNVATESMNLDFDRIGCATIRKGQTLLGNQITASTDILGVYEFRDAGDGTDNQVIAVHDTVAYYLSGSTWTSKRTGLTTGYKADFTTYLDYMFMVNGIDATQTWDGDTGTTFGNTYVSGAPVGISIEVFRNRVWIVDADDRLHYSSLPNETTSNITWDTDSQWIDISPQDGDNAVKLIRSKNSLLVFKKNHMYRVYSTQETEPDPKIDVGTYSARSVVAASDGIYFHHPSGIYRYLDGNITNISQSMVDFIDNITVTNYSKVVGWTDGNHVLFSIGDIDIGDISYTNVVLRYTISSRVWTFRSYPTQILCAGYYNDGTTIYNIAGDDNGNILKLDTGGTDNGSSIFYSLTIGPVLLDGSFNTRKYISKMAVVHENAEGTIIYTKSDNENDNKYTQIYEISDAVATPFSTDIKGNKIWLRAAGSSVGDSFTLNGYELLDIESEYYV